MFETIYLDYTGDPPAASEYTILVYKLRQAQRAQKIHEEMNARMLRRHATRVAEARARLEAEVERLRDEAKKLGVHHAGS